ncbi:uncharacterized protein BDR25DRAFT_359486 [Lindgomyces ingoldianus]|uniref:Uncharacterized protein n=1 Tax=Lindgomyces ingoldianus TaxID=673940 RepID=A0ACB6QI52_9PLEO|nr:uncharacterized protein BDR25DRAFT_359486 [Lindgomyces ingoldianus]KAF2466591.1 hypothetical protein BDR25DRAFT_359486 [Lindgomyces ingoldianus]
MLVSLSLLLLFLFPSWTLDLDAGPGPRPGPRPGPGPGPGYLRQQLATIGRHECVLAIRQLGTCNVRYIALAMLYHLPIVRLGPS